MSDEAAAALCHAPGLRAICAVTSELSRHARSIQQAKPVSAELLAQALTAAQLFSALQLGKTGARINLQLECDGPLRGLFADADAEGHVRGYAKNPLVDVWAGSAEFHWRPAFGNSGFLSVLRDLGSGETFRSSVELTHFDLARDVERFFLTSEQVDTAVALEVVASAGEPLTVVAGILVQALPGGDPDALAAARARLQAGEIRRAAQAGAGAAELARVALGGEAEVIARYPLSFRCQCSVDRVMSALTAMGREELEDLLAKDGRAEVTCQFCAMRYEVSADQLKELLAAMPRA